MSDLHSFQESEKYTWTEYTDTYYYNYSLSMPQVCMISECGWQIIDGEFDSHRMYHISGIVLSEAEWIITLFNHIYIYIYIFTNCVYR